MGFLVVFSLALLTTAQPRIFTLKADTSVWDIAVHDLNGDGRKDILALCCDAVNYPSDKHVAVFLADREGAYQTQPSVTLPLDPDGGSAFLAEVDGEPPAELVATSREGADIFAFRDDRFVPIGNHQFASLLPGGLRKPIFLEHAAVDLDGDGIDEWLVPVPSGYAVRNPGGLVCEVPCDVVSTIESGSSVYISHQFPEFHVFELADQEQKAMAFLSEDFADFAYGPNWVERRRYKLPVDREGEWAVGVQMKDIDKNGLPDLILTETHGSVQISVHTRVYLASVPFTFSDTPTVTFKTDSAFQAPLLIDVNGDERLDIVNIRVPFGLRFFVNYFLRNKLTLQARVHLLNDSGFQSSPDYVTNISIDAPEDRRRVAYTMGDFNGDGHIDLALGARSRELAIHTGSDARFISSKPWVCVSVPTFGEARPYDLNGNKNDDIVIFHPRGKLDNRVEVVVF